MADALEPDRLLEPLLQRGPFLGRGADDREPLRHAVVAGHARVGEDGAAGEQPVGQRLDRRRALAAELEAPQRPRELAATRRAPGDQGAERAQRVLFLAGEQAVAGVAAHAGRERHGAPGAAFGACPRGRAERRLGVVPQPQRGLEPAQAPAGVLERAAVAGRGVERQHRDRAHRVGAQLLRHVAQRLGAHEREPVAERHLVALEHEALDGREHDGQRAVAVGGVLELLEGGVEPLTVEREVARLGPDGGEEDLQRGVGLGAGVGRRRAAPTDLQIGREVGQGLQALDGGGIGRELRQLR